MTTNTTIDLGNNDSSNIGIFAQDGQFVAMTQTQSRWFKTRRGAARWLSKATGQAWK